MIDFLKIIGTLVGSVFLVYVLLIGFWLIRFIKNGRRFKKASKPITYRKSSRFKRLFGQLPKAIARDLINRDPDEFLFNGIHCFCGEQGSGKTISLVAKIRELKQKYPNVKVLSNFDCEFSDGIIKSWKDIVFTNYGKTGVIIALDELQNWFSCNESKDFPPEMLQEITQQRKQRKCILPTSQRFMRLAKPLREQVTMLYEPFTVFGCLTFVRVRKPCVDDQGQIDRLHTRGRGLYFFVHDDDLRASYDTLQKIERQANGGYHANTALTAADSAINNVAISLDRKMLRRR